MRICQEKKKTSFSLGMRASSSAVVICNDVQYKETSIWVTMQENISYLSIPHLLFKSVFTF